MREKAALDAKPASARERALSAGLPLLVLAAALAAFAWESWELHPQIDDAYISYRYARNLVDGYGLVYNPGEHVEGFTNLLWTLLVASGIACGLEGPQVGHALGLVSGLAVLVATFMYAQSGLSQSQRWMAALAPWIVASSGSFSLWATSGMETPLFVALATAALVAQAGGCVVGATVAVVLATLTRPEGAILAAVVLGLQWWASRRQGWRSLMPASAYATFLAGLTVFRLVYYGSPLPNTFYAKVGGIPISRGADYLLGFVAESAALLMIPAGFIALRDRRAWPGVAFTAVLALYVVSVGGDVLGPSRFLLPTLPCLAALCVRGVAAAYRESRRLGTLLSTTIPCAICWHLVGTASARFLLLVVLLTAAWTLSARWKLRVAVPAFCLALVGTAALYRSYDPAPLLGDVLRRGGALDAPRSERLQKRRTTFLYHERTGRATARLLLQQRPPVGLVASIAIGKIGYYSGLPILDLVGLVDPVVARSGRERSGMLLPGHQRSNADYVFSRRPDYILIPKRGEKTWLIPAVAAIWAHSDLDTYYEWDNRVRGYKRRSRFAQPRSLKPNPRARPSRR